MEHRIALYPGDGIGREVTDEVVRVLEALEARLGTFHLRLTSLPWGCDYWDSHGQVAPDDFLEELRGHDAIFLGALGLPSRLPDHVTLEPLIQIRQSFDQYACVRPAKLLPGVRCPLAGYGPGDVDLVVVRENSEGEYVSHGGRFKKGRPEEFATQTALHTRHGVERVLRFAFELAMKRRRHLTMITKSNAQRFGYVLWDEILEELRGDYPQVTADRQHVDAAAMNFVRCPETFDVVVASNLFGDILTDLGGVIAGGLGLAPSANLDPDRRHPSLFEPVHGSAPDIAGRGIANPVGAILSAALMLDWLELRDAARSVEEAVARVLGEGHGTPDLGGELNSQELTDHIIHALE
ncbi:MAG: tartrate dehydrogenase [Planctomycetota bacterium]|nr:tartrate dehydrogenase [Planctomycetota bacterium]